MRVAGLPLVAHSVRHALAATSVEVVLVSTDDAEIAGIARDLGAEVVVRPPELAADAVSSESALIHALDERVRMGEFDPELVVFLQCTSPVRRPGDIDAAVAALDEGDADAVFSAVRDRALYWSAGPEGVAPVNYDPLRRLREQDMATQLRENGSIYVVRTESLRETGNRLGKRRHMYEMDLWSSFQIDAPEDVELVEWILSRPEFSPTVEWPQRIDLVVFDFDGVLTDNTVLVSEAGDEAVRCDRSDGWGIGRLREAGIDMLILSTEEHPVVSARARKLKLPCLQGVADKGAALAAELARRGIDAANVVYLGNDANDLGCFALAGLPVAVADAHPEAIAAVRLVLSRPGGRGAVRELCDLVLRRQ